jgi:phage virion morphogenesis protein
MAQDTITIKAETDEVNALLDRLIAKDKTRPLMQRIGAILQNDAKLNFRKQSAPDGTPWKKTARGGQILSDTRRLRNSIQHEWGNDYAKVGTNVVYGPIHQYGLSGSQSVAAHVRRITQAFGNPLAFPVYVNVGSHTRKMNVPARPFLGVGKRAADKINRALDEWIAQFQGQ